MTSPLKAGVKSTYLDFDRLLSSISKHAFQIKIQESETQALVLSQSKETLIFETQGFLQASYLNQESPPTSPFSTQSSKVYRYELGAEKLWRSGIRTNINYSLSDTSTSFFSGNQIEFINPRLELSLSSYLFQDLFFEKYKHLENEVKNSVKALEIKNRVLKKQTLSQGLIFFSTVLEQQEALGLQLELCKKIKTQTQTIKRQRKRQSISARDYYLSLRESTQCQAEVDELEKLFKENKQSFGSLYNVGFEALNISDSKVMFQSLNATYLKFLKENPTVEKTDSKDEVKYLDSLLLTAQSKRKKLEALSKVNLSTELKAGVTGLDREVSESHQDLSKMQYPFISVGLRLDLPFVNREAEKNSVAAKYEQQAIEQRLDYAKAQDAERFSTLSASLKSDFLIYEKQMLSLTYSQRVLFEARKDFSNGRISLNTLLDFNKNVIQDQKNLSSYRISIMRRMIEYLDFQHYFDSFI